MIQYLFNWHFFSSLPPKKKKFKFFLFFLRFSRFVRVGGAMNLYLHVYSNELFRTWWNLLLEAIATTWLNQTMLFTRLLKVKVQFFFFTEGEKGCRLQLFFGGANWSEDRKH